MSARSFLKAASVWYCASFMGLPVSRCAAMKNTDRPSVFCRDGTITLPLYFASQTSAHDAGAAFTFAGAWAMPA